MWRVRHPKLYRLPGTGGRCGQLIIRQGPRLFHLQELKGVGRSCLPSGQELKAGGYTGETGPERPRRQTAEADERKRTGEEQTDKSRRAKYPRQMLIISDIRVPLVFCKVELYSQLAGNVFPPHWEYVPNMQGTRSQLSGNIWGKRSCQPRGFYSWDLSEVGGRRGQLLRLL